jgi:hypothetical protein
MAIGPSLVSPPWGCGHVKSVAKNETKKNRRRLPRCPGQDGMGSDVGSRGGTESQQKAKSDGEQWERGRAGGTKFDRGFVWSKSAETTMGVKTRRFSHGGRRLVALWKPSPNRVLKTSCHVCGGNEMTRSRRRVSVSIDYRAMFRDAAGPQKARGCSAQHHRTEGGGGCHRPLILDRTTKDNKVTWTSERSPFEPEV